MFSDLQYEKKLQKDKIVKHTVEIQYKISNYITSNP